MKGRCVAVLLCLFFSFNLISFFSFLSCYQPVVHAPESIGEDDAKVTAYLNALPIYLPDTCVLHIRQEIPEKFHDLFCQRLYAMLPTGLPVHLKVAHLEAYKKYLPPTPSQHHFIQQMLDSPESEWVPKDPRLAEAEKRQKMARLETLLAILLLLLALVVVFWGFVRQSMRYRVLLQTSTTLQQEKEWTETLPIQAPMKILTDTDWRRFRDHFETVFPNYTRQLQVDFPALTSAEIRLFMLIKLGFGNNEIAGTLGISQESVYKSRFRLRKKLGCSKDLGLDEFVQAYAAALQPDVKS